MEVHEKSEHETRGEQIDENQEGGRSEDREGGYRLKEPEGRPDVVCLVPQKNPRNKPENACNDEDDGYDLQTGLEEVPHKAL